MMDLKILLQDNYDDTIEALVGFYEKEKRYQDRKWKNRPLETLIHKLTNTHRTIVTNSQLWVMIVALTKFMYLYGIFYEFKYKEWLSRRTAELVIELNKAGWLK